MYQKKKKKRIIISSLSQKIFPIKTNFLFLRQNTEKLSTLERERESINQKIVPKEEEKRIIISFGHGGSGHSQLTSEGANCR